MVFRVNIPLEIERSAGELSNSTVVDVQVLYQAGRWRAQCRRPPVATGFCDTMEASLVAVAKEISREWNAEAIETPGGSALL